MRPCLTEDYVGTKLPSTKKCAAGAPLTLPALEGSPPRQDTLRELVRRQKIRIKLRKVAFEAWTLALRVFVLGIGIENTIDPILPGAADRVD